MSAASAPFVASLRRAWPVLVAYGVFSVWGAGCLVASLALTSGGLGVGAGAMGTVLGILAATAVGHILGNLLGLVRLRLAVIVVLFFVALILATLSGAAIGAFALFLIVGVVAALGGYLGVASRLDVVASWFPLSFAVGGAIVWMNRHHAIDTFHSGAKHALWDPFTIVCLSGAVFLNLVFLATRHSLGLTVWQEVGRPAGARAAANEAVAVARPGRGSILVLLAFSMAVLGVTALISPYLFRTYTPEHAEGDGSGKSEQPDKGNRSNKGDRSDKDKGDRSDKGSSKGNGKGKGGGSTPGDGSGRGDSSDRGARRDDGPERNNGSGRGDGPPHQGDGASGSGKGQPSNGNGGGSGDGKGKGGSSRQAGDGSSSPGSGSGKGEEPGKGKGGDKQGSGGGDGSSGDPLGHPDGDGASRAGGDALALAMQIMVWLLAFAFALLVVLAIAFPPMRRAFLLRHLERPIWPVSPTTRTINLWRRALAALAVVEIMPASGETPCAFARRANEELASRLGCDAPGLEEAAALVERVDYAGRGLGAGDERTMRAAVTALVRAVGARVALKKKLSAAWGPAPEVEP